MPPVIELLLPTTTRITKIQQFLARAFALSFQHNPRNIEYDWYAYWNHILFDIVKDKRNLIVCPQYLVWVTSDDTSAINQQSIDSLTKKHTKKRMELRTVLRRRKAKGPNAIGVARSSRSVEAPAAINPTEDSFEKSTPPSPTTSNAGSAHSITLPPDAATRIVDFAILNISEGHDSKDDPVSPDDVTIASIKVELIMEIKRFARRRSTGANLKIQVNTLIDIAIKDALVQAALLFERFPELESVIAIGGSGDYWRHATIQRKNINPEILKSLSIDTNYNDNFKAVSWSQAYPVDSKISKKRLRKIFNKIRG